MPTAGREAGPKGVSADAWPVLPRLADWKDTCDTVHMWTQIVGKVKLALAPPVNHWWHVPLYVGARGLTTGSIPYGAGLFEATFDFLDDHLRIETSSGLDARLALRPRTVADFYREFMEALDRLGIRVSIWPMPVEVEAPIRFDEDVTHAAYDGAAMRAFWQALVHADRLLKVFRSGFVGKCSPVHFFWGSFDLAVTRFSGRRAPDRDGADRITLEAYSHEVSSAGFWPGGGGVKGAAFYAYMAPEPSGYQTARVRPDQAFYSSPPGEYLLLYDDARSAASPDAAVMAFLESTYDAGATLAGWNRAELERA